jgi:hypothetical protein
MDSNRTSSRIQIIIIYLEHGTATREEVTVATGK